AETPLSEVVNTLEVQTKQRFDLDQALAKPRAEPRITLELSAVKLSEVLRQIAQQAHCELEVLPGSVVRFVPAPEEGSFVFDVKRNRWANTINAYKVNEEGEIVFAPDMGQEGDKSYPISVPHGWWEEEMIEVLFKCRSLSIFDIVDSRRLTVLDTLTILGPDNSPPQQWGSSYIAQQAAKEGKVITAAVAFVAPEQRVKLFMSTGLFGIKYLLSNASEYLPGRQASILEEPLTYKEITKKVEELSQGVGYGPETSVVFYPAYRAARDMWVLDDVRMKALERFGVKNRRLWELHNQKALPEAQQDPSKTDARQSLLEAREAFGKADYVKAVAAARRAAGLESRGYPDVRRTANDTVNGIIFYLALLLPFSFFCERLFIGGATILKRIAGFVGFFIAVFAILRFVHPAFQLVGTTPYIILLAFVILVLGAVVLFIVMNKFSQEIQKSKRASAGMHEVDVGRLSATTAAVLLGISNLRRRKLRTGLTATTLVLLTFTVLSFTSIEAKLKYYKLPRDNQPTYQGALIRDRNWLGLQPSVLEYVKSAFTEHATVIPRAWYQAQSKGERAHVRFLNAETGRVSFANGLVGMVAEEPVATGVDALLKEGSRWFAPGERDGVIIPDDLAQLVDIGVEDVGTAKIVLFGSSFTVIGIIDSEEFNKLKDLDNEKLTPVDFVTEATKAQKGQQQDPNLAAAEPIQSFTHLESSNTLLLPFDYVIENDGVWKPEETEEEEEQEGKAKAFLVDTVEQFMSRVALTVFVGTKETEADPGQVEVYSSIGGTSISGVTSLLIPIAVAALIVLNTMIGAVYERSREIGIYTSVGLTPKHIGALFMAESAVFATLGAVIGYLIGQVLSMVFVQTGWLSGINLNYSSLSAIWSTVVVMGVTLLSTLYPARVAAYMAVPDVSRSWKFPEPEGDFWYFDFPFTVGGAEALGLYSYLTTVFESYGEGSIGDFVAEDVALVASGEPQEPMYVITMKVWLAPYDLGISQTVRLEATPTGEFGIYKIGLVLVRESGDVASWRRINRGFLNRLRKRFLVWRT
ncbi:MAG: FtsX-like permease family protein, partial [Planctomycetes bacterium]|nr:FtsX-like permease family protein [Planctomycetota bacterium]